MCELRNMNSNVARVLLFAMQLIAVILFSDTVNLPSFRFDVEHTNLSLDNARN